MAGDWIKMRSNLWDDPRVASLVDATDTSEAMIVGGLYWLWATADQHTEDGVMPGLTLRQIDRKTSIPGFGAALVAVGWLAEIEAGVTLSNFTEHNGASAKRRATDAQRKANGRNSSAFDADNVRTDGGQDAPNLGAREREEKEKEVEKEEKAPRVPRSPAPTLEGVPPNLMADYMAVRKAKKAGPFTDTAITALQREASKAGLTLCQAVTACVEFSWQGFNAGWYAERMAGKPAIGLTVPSAPGRDPALQKIDDDAKRAVRPSLEQLERMAELRRAGAH